MSDEVRRQREERMHAQMEAQRRDAMADDREMRERMKEEALRQREERMRMQEEQRMRDLMYDGERQRPNIPPEEMPESLRPNNAQRPDPEPVPVPRSQPQPQPRPQPQPHPQPEPGMPDFKMSASQQTSAPRRNSTQSMREQMRANKVNQQQHTTTTSQTEEYVEQTVSEGQKTSPDNQPNNPRSNNTTTIIGGSSNNEDTGGKKKGFQFNKKSGWIIIALIAGILVGAYVVFGKGSGGGGEKGTAEADPNQQIPNQDELEWINPDDINLTPSYSPEEIEQLRAAGYTGPEIEKYSSQGVDVDDLLRQSAAARDAYQKQANKDLYDVASPEFKHYIGQTWLTLPKRNDIQDWKLLGFQYTEKKNLDYEKIDVYGNQLFLKIYLDDKDHVSWFYLNVTPEEWNSLNDSGNVVVTYTYATHIVGDDVINGVEDKQNIYIIDASLEILENEVN